MALIVKNLEREVAANSPASEWAISTLTTLRQRSPTSLHVSLAAMRENPNKTRYTTYQREYALASHFVAQPDFFEGVNARLITRTEPKWSLPPEALSQPPSWVQEHVILPGHFNEPVEEPFYLLQNE